MDGLSARLSTVLLAASALWVTQANAGNPYPDKTTPTAIDQGELGSVAAATPLTLTVTLRLTNLAEAEALLTSIYTPGNAKFHQFLSAAEFNARFAPSDEAVARVIAGLARYGLTAQRSTATTLSVSGLPADIERAFAVTLHRYSVKSHGGSPGFQFHAPLSAPSVPSELTSLVSAVAGLDTQPHFAPRSHAAELPPKVSVTPSKNTANQPGYYTVTDFDNYYDVQPLLQQGVSGAGGTIGILTFANYTPSDAYAYWSALGLKVSSKRLSVINVDGGPGAPSDASGSLETTIDVEQSGGVAPGANVIVYMAPNTNQGFVDLFAKAVDSNAAATLSMSWGAWEWFQNAENSPVTDPITGMTTGITQATHELLVRAALQGQTMLTSAGDGGAYEADNDGFGPPDYSLVLSVDYPASDPAMTAAGGTTLASTQSFTITGQTKPYVINIPHERVWGWDWLEPLCEKIGVPDPTACGIFPGGGGGGVSVLFARPFYQYGVAGVQLSQPNQAFIQESPAPAQLLYALPAYYPGRNVPDISMDADPYTGYVVYYTSDQTGYGIQAGWGGTSFVAPQLNGVSALINQYTHSRIGFLNPTLYALYANGAGYRGSRAPFHAIPYGDNWFYQGSYGYNPAVGIGTLDVANFAASLFYF